MEIDWDTIIPNEIFKAYENISKCFKKTLLQKNRKNPRNIEKIPKHFNWCINVF